MLDKVIYKNHKGKTIEFGKNGIFLNMCNLRDYKWEYAKKNNKISGFSKSIVEKNMPVIIHCTSEEDGVEKKNRLFEVAEEDVLAFKHGELIIGEYHLKCFVIGSSKDNYLINKGHLETKLNILTDYPEWTRETTTSFKPGTEAATVGQNLDYPHDYKYDYMNGMNNTRLNNAGFESDFEMIIYGSCSNPVIHVANHTYAVSATLETGEYLTINSKTKKIYKTRIDGSTENQFHLRSRESYIFEKIPSGSNAVSWNGLFGFDITLLEERSEPKWI